ncbi:MAG: transglycosylase domain-containing protein [Leptospiraceae bacterium]|nr:transglycosylase domain-containing protein [Leptospiraceae bacterium]MDW7977108.1 transglycosylase domain-containing protein [Leptospiraceae bacterium]
MSSIIIFLIKLLFGIIRNLFTILLLILVGIGVLTIWDFSLKKKDYEQKIEDWKLWLHGKGTNIPVPIYHYIYDRNGLLIGEYTPILGSYIPINRCEKLHWLNKATVVAEDQEFYQHKGISIKGILRAMWYNLKTFSLSQGGGTITQQLARNLFTGHEKTFQRKLLETLLAFMLEKEFKKKEILCLYLNKIYMGNNRFGAEEASWFYFNKPPEALTAAEASLLVGMFPSPERYNPLKNLDNALQKQRIIMQKLVEARHLTPEAAEKELANFLSRYRVDPQKEDPGAIAQFGSNRYFRLNKAPEVNEYVKQFLEENLPIEILNRQSFHIHTTIDLKSQEYALQVLREYIRKIRQENFELYLRYNLDPNLANHIQGVLISMDIPSGHIRALVGGYEIYETGILSYRIFRMRRQVGSTIKGFLYALALHRKVYDLNSSVVDEPVNFGGYKPVNWYNSYLGEVPLKTAIARSINTTAVKTLDTIGIDFFIEELTQALGISYFDAKKRFPRNLTVALGSFELSPMELTILYSALLNEGYKVSPILIQKIETRDDGIVVYEDETSQKNISIVSYEASAAILELLKGVVEEEEDGTAGWIGKKKKETPNFLPYEIAGKTGTTQIPPEIRKKYNNIKGIRDSWFVGMIPTNVTTVWVGNDKGVPLNAYAPQVWVDYMSKAMPEPIEQKFPEPKKMEWFDFFQKPKQDFH